MSAPLNRDPDANGINEWTVMVFIANNDDLSPLIVSQLKAIKEAGFQNKTDVLVYVDATEQGAPTRVYNVNQGRKKLRNEEIGDGENPYVRNLVRDDIDFSAIAIDKPFSKALRTALENTASPVPPFPLVVPNTSSVGQLNTQNKALDALRTFINFGRENHRAKHYILFMLGHGQIVGNDAFLPDVSSGSAIKLTELGAVLREFKNLMQADTETLELLAMHSCSMSAAEVAFELQGTAKYMLGSEGTTFVGSWPYRQVLKKIFKMIREAQDAAKGPGKEPEYDIDTLIQKIYFLSLFQSTDFMLSGFSSDLSLCNLDPTILNRLKERLITLVEELKKGLDEDTARELIVLAHCKSQSYWNESYTDLYDFCECLQKLCEARQQRYLNDPLLTSFSKETIRNASNYASWTSLSNACGAVIRELEKDRSDPFSRPVIFSEYFGPKYQYSHGLSVYFPWAKPIGNANEKVIANYREYRFTTDFPENGSWLSFVEKYCENTKRLERIKEDKERSSAKSQAQPSANGNGPSLVTFAESSSHAGALEQKAGGALENKAGGAVGSTCDCPSIKNYEKFSISPAAALAFSEDSDDEEKRLPERRKSAKRQAASTVPT